MKARPILFSDEMVRAILAGQKTQTRRLVTAANSLVDGEPNASLFARLALPSAVVDPGPSPAGNPGPYLKAFLVGGDTRHRVYPRYHLTKRLWVRETWALEDLGDDGERVVWHADLQAAWRSKMAARFYVADYRPRRWRPSIHMPRWASRLTLEITGVRVERLQDISEEDARAEGHAWRYVWEYINGAGAWEANPWVWVVEFRKVGS